MGRSGPDQETALAPRLTVAFDRDETILSVYRGSPPDLVCGCSLLAVARHPGLALVWMRSVRTCSTVFSGYSECFTYYLDAPLSAIL